MSAVELPGDEPTGDVAFPFILVEGEEKAGKTSAALLLARSRRIGHTFVLELGESKADEYNRLAPGRYRILRHNGTYWQIMQQLERAIAAPRVDPDTPNLIIFDTVTALWDMEKARVDRRARRGAEAKAKKYNQTFNPDEEIKAPFNLWSDAKTRWYRVINLLRQSNCIVVVIARGKDAMKMEDGKPVEGETEWKVQTEGNLKFEVDAWVRMLRPHTATLVGAGSWNVEITDDKGVSLPDGNPKQDRNFAGPLEHLIFEILGVGGAAFVTRQASVNASVGIGVAAAKNGLVTRFLNSCDEERATQEAAAVWRKAGYGNLPKDAEITDEQWSKLMVLVAERITEINAPREPVLAPANTSEPPAATMGSDERVTEGPDWQSSSPTASPDGPSQPVEKPATPPVTEPEPEPAAAKVETVNMGRDFSRLASEPELQEQAMKWLRDNYGCAPMVVPVGDVEEVRAYLEELLPPPPPFTDEDINPELSRRRAAPATPVAKVDPKRKANADDLDRLRASLRDHGITGPERQRVVGRICGRTVRDFANLKVGEVQKVIDTLDSMDTSAPSLLDAAS